MTQKEIGKLGREIGILYDKVTTLKKGKRTKAVEKKILALSSKIGAKKALLYDNYQHTTKDPNPLVIPNPDTDIEREANTLLRKMTELKRELYIARVIKDNIPFKLIPKRRELDMPQTLDLNNELEETGKRFVEIKDDLHLILRVKNASQIPKDLDF